MIFQAFFLQCAEFVYILQLKLISLSFQLHRTTPEIKKISLAVPSSISSENLFR